METYNWIVLAIAVAGAVAGLRGIASAVQAGRQRNPGAAVLFLVLGGGVLAASIYAGYLAAGFGSVQI